ncbi:hypothetical protein [Stackebrandtia soli]|uniref:hypothetical protein n=1 Tax=Stackebrandtia soli TaxID=1892856 RepID=UPI0039EAC6D7
MADSLEYAWYSFAADSNAVLGTALGLYSLVGAIMAVTGVLMSLVAAILGVIGLVVTYLTYHFGRASALGDASAAIQNARSSVVEYVSYRDGLSA